MEKIKDVKVRHVVFDYLHNIMFMSINSGEMIISFKTCEREKMLDLS
jgi:hypothetical protein